ncbi:hypothetical protein [Amycolatopsis minnesotensis]|uniref:Glycine zipper domain-containing protein n=1 Tax=Amycolatopsis minnesotensis TaxID=337894 RepID=A0ABP5CVV3_9PSEU
MGNDANTAGETLKGAAIGAGTGAAVGSVVPVIGTAAGAVVGGVVGGLVGLMSGGPEAQKAEASFNNRTIDGRQIWEQITQGIGSESLHGGHRAAVDLSKTHDTRSQQIAKLNSEMDAHWVGNSGQAAQNGAHPLGVWLKDSSTNLDNSGKYLGSQATSFDNVHKNVQEIAKDPPEAGFVDGINPMSDKDDQIEEYNKQGQHNVQAFTTYFSESAQNAAGMPKYNAWDGNKFSDTGDGGDFGGGGGPGGSFGGGGVGGGGGGIPEGKFTMPKSEIPNTSHLTDPNDPRFNSDIPKTDIPKTDLPKFDDSTTQAGYTPPSFNTGGLNSNFGPGGGSASFGPGGGGGGGAGDFSGGAFGPGGAGLGAGSATGSGAGAAGAGKGGAMGAGAMGAGKGMAGKAGMAGMGGMAGHGAKGKGQEDEEHQSKYLVGDDPNEIFGTDELTAPPVIGE